ncbi:MAG: DNA internalization-related competence protein ComEC/Rec2 [Oscillospiraceae bacterium]|nr:DNA internalization-related competence protein ComEC/Rec2 [Oscillospiraceae bacterium]
MRKLAVASGAFVCAVFLAHYVLPSSWLLPLAAGLALVGILLVLLERKWLLGPILVLLAAAFGFYVFRMNEMLTVERAAVYDGQTLSGSAEVLSWPEDTSGGVRAEVRLRLDGEKPIRTMLYDRSGTLAEAAPDDTLRGEFRLRRADTRYGEAYDTDLAKGVFLRANVIGEPERIAAARHSARGLFVRLNHAVTERIKAYFPADTEAFFSSLMLGEKTELYRDDALYLAMKRSGFMHLAAVSGMHISMLVAVLLTLFGNRKPVVLFSIVLIWAFALTAGSTPSAVRAAFMLTTMLLAPLLGRENDPPTSLLFSLALILLVNPYAAASVSLQLSFASMAGLLLFYQKLYPRLKKLVPAFLPRFVRRYLCASASSSLSVLVFSIPITALRFGTVALLSPLGNLLVMWLIPLCFAGGYAAVLLSCFWSGGAAFLAAVVSWPARLVFLIARFISSLPISTLYLSTGLSRAWLVFVYLLLAAALLIRAAEWKRWVYPSCLAVLSLFVMLAAVRHAYSAGSARFAAIDVGQGQSLAVIDGDTTLLVDCGSSFSLDNAGDLASAYLLGRGRERIDLLLLTHLHADHANGVLRLMEAMPVGAIVIGDELDDPNGLLDGIRESARRHGTELLTVSSDRDYALSDCRIRVFAPGERGDANERCLQYLLTVRGIGILITGDANRQAELELLEHADLRDVEILVVGHHGSKTSCSEELLSAICADRAVISVGYNTYGHPSEEVLERLRENGYTVYRTDEDGTVELLIG